MNWAQLFFASVLVSFASFALANEECVPFNPEDTRIVDRGPVNTELMALVPAPETNCRSLFWSFLNQSFNFDFANRHKPQVN